MLIPVPEEWRNRLHTGAKPVQARDSATIAVLRDGDAGLEAFLMRRQTSMAFAPGMYVFPGGSVDNADAAPLPWIGPDAAYFASRFNCTVETAHTLVVAAARETFEETGVLLAGSSADSVVSDARIYHDARAALENHELSFAEFLTEHQLSLRADLLGAWAHWITPVFEPRRFDTRFFVALLPEGQRIDSVSGEADSSAWVPLSDVLELVKRGEAAMMPPTEVTCGELAAVSLATVMRASSSRQISAIEPKLVDIQGKLWLDTGRDT